MEPNHRIAYIFAIIAVALVFLSGPIARKLNGPSSSELSGDLSPLPPPSAYNERIVIPESAAASGTGTAFAINRNGDWLTARHVVSGCDSVSLRTDSGDIVEASHTIITDRLDMAIIQTGASPSAVPLEFSEPLSRGQYGFMVGYPQGRAAAISTKLRSRAILVTDKAKRSEEPLLTWTIANQSYPRHGTLGGLSGGPVFDGSGKVRGVIVAENPRHGRVYSTTPVSIQGFLKTHGIFASEGEAAEYNTENLLLQSRSAMSKLQVVKVLCVKE